MMALEKLTAPHPAQAGDTPMPADDDMTAQYTTQASPTVMLDKTPRDDTAPHQDGEPLATTTTRLGLVRPNMPAPTVGTDGNSEHADIDADTEPLFNASALLAEQDAEVELDLNRLSITHDPADNPAPIMEADDDWYEQVLAAQEQGSKAKREVALEEVREEGWVPPEIQKQREVLSAKRSRWRVVSVVLAVAAVATLALSIWLATGGLA